MKNLSTAGLTAILLFSITLAQTPAPSTPPQRQPSTDDVVRISTSLVQTDLVVTDKDGHVIPDLKVEDFRIFENGKRQEIKFMEFVGADAGPRIEGDLVIAGKPVEPEIAKNLASRDLRRVFAFVVDDLTVPIEDVASVRQLLTDFVDNRMREGDLVAIVRVVGGGGLLEQFTSDKAILRRAIAHITPQLHPFSAFDNLPSDQHINTQLALAAEAEGVSFPAEAISASNTNLDTSNEGINRGFRALLTLQVAAEVTSSLKGLPGRKSLVLISGGLPLSESGPTQITVDGLPITLAETRNYLGNATFLLRQLIDRASRAGVVINTMDIRGLKSSRGVSKFTDPGNEATSGLFGGNSGGATFGRTPNMGQFDNLALDTLSSHLGLKALAESTGGVSVINTSNFNEGLDRILARSSYYILAYAPTETFDNKYHKLEIKVTRPDAKVYSREGYFATPDQPTRPLTKEETILKTVMSPLAKRDVEVAGRVQYRFSPEVAAELDISMLINANNISFKKETDDKYRATFDVVGFIANSVGKSAGGFSQTVTVSLSPPDYQRALATGLSYTAHAQLPPGSYQLRAVVRDSESGRLGSMTQYIEIPDLNKKHVTASSVFLYAIDISQGSNTKPEPLTALRQLPRKQDLRYAVVVYNPKLVDGQTQLRSQIVVSRGGKVIFQEPESPVGGTLQNGQIVKLGQLGLGNARPGRYVLTIVITDPQAKKEERTILRSVDFYLVD
ncbi:MAG: VWA domain-containing protein [Acidobacteriota bacterium]